MGQHPSSSDRLVEVLLDQFIGDRDEGRVLSIEHYLSRCVSEEERHKLASLMEAYDDVDTFLPQPRETPTRLGEYRITGVIARGGMGVVYAGYDAKRREVAIKTLPDLDSGAVPHEQRFSREMRALEEVDHPGIVRILDSGSSDGLSYLVMERLKGGTLRDRLDEDRDRASLPDDEAVRRSCQLIAQVARATAAAHDHGILHRDIKPSNILFDDDGNPHLADFGLAHIDDLSTLTEKGCVLGTAAYLAPERLLDNCRPHDRRVDVYSLGVTLYESVTLSRPFRGTLTEIQAAVRRGPPHPRLYLGRPIDRGLLAILERALEANPKRRYASMEAFASDLEAWVHGGDVQARRGAEWRRLQRSIYRHHYRWTIAAVLLLLMLGAWGFERHRTRTRAEQHFSQGEEKRIAFEETLSTIASIREDDAESHRYEWGVKIQPDDLEARVTQGLLEKETENAIANWRQAFLHYSYSLTASKDHRRYVEAMERLLRKAGSWFERAGDFEEASQSWAWLDEWVGGSPGASSIVIDTEPSGAKVKLLRYRWEDQEVHWIEEPVAPNPEDRTPKEYKGLQVGSYVAELVAPGSERVIRYPILLHSDEDYHSGPIELPDDDLFGGDWIYVPRGPFVAGGDSTATESEPRTVRVVEGFFIKKREETFSEYREFLLDLLERGIVCRHQDLASQAKTRDWTPGLPLHVPRDRFFAEGDLGMDWVLGQRAQNYYRPENVVHSISYCDALHYVEWLNEKSLEEKSPWVYALPTSDQWEKAARGVDGRPYPWGKEFSWKQTYGFLTRAYVQFPSERHMTPGLIRGDLSPYGLWDTAGNVREFCADYRTTFVGLDNNDPTYIYLVRGGEESFLDPDAFRLAARRGASFMEFNWDFGIRLVRTLRQD